MHETLSKLHLKLERYFVGVVEVQVVTCSRRTHRKNDAELTEQPVHFMQIITICSFCLRHTNRQAPFVWFTERIWDTGVNSGMIHVKIDIFLRQKLDHFMNFTTNYTKLSFFASFAAKPWTHHAVCGYLN